MYGIVGNNAQMTAIGETGTILTTSDGADKTGVNDATASLQRAIDSGEVKRGRVGWDVVVVYLPNGTYRVSNSINWKVPLYTIGPPAAATNVFIKGFDIGIFSQSRSSVTLSRIVLQNQNKTGIVNLHYPLYIDSLTSTNTVTAAVNRSDGIMVLVDARLDGGSSDRAAVVNDVGAKMIFARDVAASGYQRAILNNAGPRQSPSGLTVGEYVSHRPVTLFPSPERTLKLPKKFPPEPVWEQTMTRWALVDNYRNFAGTTDTPLVNARALQAAIDDTSKTAICLPCCKQYSIRGPVYIRGKISRITTVGSTLTAADSTTQLIIADGTAPVVKLDRLCSSFTNLPIVDSTSRTVVLQSLCVGDFRHKGAGDLFIVDCVSPLKMTNAAAHTWAWHFDAEGSTGYMLDMTAGTARIFGWKDEGMGTSVRMTGGVAELLGFFNRSSCTQPKPVDSAQFIISNAQFSAAAATQNNYCDN
jgi:hypothetical protein